jgi:hypothetical protein
MYEEDAISSVKLPICADTVGVVVAIFNLQFKFHFGGLKRN